MTPSLFTSPVLAQPLPEPPSHRHAPTARRLAEAHQQYRLAFGKAQAVDSPHSYHAALSEEQKAALRAERWSLVKAREAAYLDLLAKATKTSQPKVSAVQPVQLSLFADAWPASFAHIAARFPRRPYVSNDLKFSTVRPLDQAAGWNYVQHNPPTMAHVMIVDYDGETPVSEVWQAAGLPTPTWIAHTPGTSRGHLAWALEKPVCTSNAARLAPLRYLAAIEQAYTTAVKGDHGYAGLLTKNPVHQSWQVDWLDPVPRTLEDLASAVQLPKPGKHAAPVPAVGFGRKVTTFDTVRHWAYSAVSQFWSLKDGQTAWDLAVRNQVDAVNATFIEALPEAHCRSIAKSISKWVWTRFTPLTKHQMVQATHTPEVQAMRGRLKGATRRDASIDQARAMEAAGETQRAISMALGVSQQTICNWLRRFDKKPISDNSGFPGCSVS